MRDRPSPQHKLEWPGGVVPEWAKPPQNNKRRGGKGRGGERQGGSSPSKRERLQKVMAQSGHGSRRNIEILIAQGHLTINGQLAKLGDAVGPGDKVKLDGRLLQLRFGDLLPRVLLYHKPAGEIVSRDDPEKRPTVFDKLPRVNGARWVSVGRLDFNTEGLLIFTTSGELANRLTHPKFEVEREYAVRVMGELGEEQQKKLLEGVDIDGELCKFDAISDRGGEGSNHWYHVILREGKNREVRKMMDTVNLMVSRLMRVRFGPIELPSHVKRGMIREMEEEQVQELLAFAGMNEPPPGESAEDDGESELDNIGNRAPDPSRDARRQEVHVDDDIGNRFVKGGDAAATRVEDEDIGNRGTYGEDVPVSQHKPQRPHGKRPFFKKHGDGNQADSIGNVAPRPPQGGHGQGQGQRHGQGHGQGHGPAAGQGEGHGKKNRHRNRNKHKVHGQPGQGQPHNQGQGQPGQGQQPAQGQPHQAQPQGQPGQPGQGKRHRRHKNRNRNRGGSNQAPPSAVPT